MAGTEMVIVTGITEEVAVEAGTGMIGPGIVEGKETIIIEAGAAALVPITTEIVAGAGMMIDKVGAAHMTVLPPSVALVLGVLLHVIVSIDVAVMKDHQLQQVFLRKLDVMIHVAHRPVIQMPTTDCMNMRVRYSLYLRLMVLLACSC